MTEITPDTLTLLEQRLAFMSDSFALAMSEELSNSVRVSAPTVTMRPVEEMLAEEQQVLQTTFSYGAIGTDEGLLCFDASEAPLLAHVAAGGSGVPSRQDLGDEQMNQLAEMMNGFVQGFGSVIGTALDKPAQPGPVDTSLDKLVLPPSFAITGTALDARFGYAIEGIVNGAFHLVLTPDMALQLLGEGAGEDVAAAPSGSDTGFQAIQATPASGAAASAFHPVEAYPGNADGLPRGVDLILDIPLEVTVELGRVRMLIKDVLELTSGSIVELDRLAGEPIDLLVNGRLVAKGEVVVVDDNFGVRVTDIVNQADRVAGLGHR